MRRITRNQLLFGSLVSLVAYGIAGAILPLPILSSTASLLLLVCGAFVLYRYLPMAWTVVLLQRHAEDPSERGGHYAVYGTTLLAIGSVYVGIFGLLWIWFGQPPHWLGTPLSGFGRYIMGAGFWLMFISPDISVSRPIVPNTVWLIVFAVLALAAAFLLGTQVRLVM